MWAWASVLGGVKSNRFQVLAEPGAANPWGGPEVLAAPGLHLRGGGMDGTCPLLAGSPGISSRNKVIREAGSRKDRSISFLVKHRKFLAADRRKENKGD